MDRLAQIVGFVSAALTTSAFLPQVIKTWRTRSTADLSPLMFTLFCVGILGWLIYGIFRHDLPMILANSVTICLAGTIMYFILQKRSSCRIAHAAIYVNNLETMKDFYCNAFGASCGLKYTNQKKGFSSYFIIFPVGARLELMHQEGIHPDNFKCGHIAISVGSKGKVDSFTGTLRRHSAKIQSEPRLTGDGYYESIISDPEGNLIEITV
jgi:lactoylglutathione lyase